MSKTFIFGVYKIVLNYSRKKWWSLSSFQSLTESTMEDLVMLDALVYLFEIALSSSFVMQLYKGLKI
tara:strand:+ start:851 stop:1051 length:201 start_codon:yes stop_codon:yes gene_type:complete